ncbi:hypothetical protein [Flavobacterium oreochromis]|uniref:Uncharacterized protein n=1 Tax=Flavobacterium columnare TaxID=996 RepID=A0A246GBS6_9FLAO|nr:hypothetical protein [Flavobacterium oreochromis]OWP76527.1 hypothetical protein BWK62_09320 [Flavobacterium oreochromis]
MEIGVFITSIVGAIGSTGFITFLFTRSKYKIEVLQAKENAETTAIDNDVKLSNHYKDILDDLQKRYENKYHEFENMMSRKVEILEEEIKMRDRKIRLLEREIVELKRENKNLKNAKSS